MRVHADHATASLEGVSDVVLGSGRPTTIMTVHAHPDDEASKGAPTLARYAAQGARTVLVCCTGGEVCVTTEPRTSLVSCRLRTRYLELFKSHAHALRVRTHAMRIAEHPVGMLMPPLGRTAPPGMLAASAPRARHRTGASAAH